MATRKPIRILCVGAGNTGRSHILACHQLDGFEIVGICTRRPESRATLMSELGHAYPEYNDFQKALEDARPDAVCIATYLETHFAYTKLALEAGCHVFVEKPLAATVAEAEALCALAQKRGLKLLIGYVLRHHPSWMRFVEMARILGKPLVMRMNLNQQSSGASWEVHKQLMATVSPVVDCGVHYVDVMSQMTQARPLRVSSIGARLSQELPPNSINYGQLQVTFDDGSVGWYEAGWGPMMSENAFFIKDVIGPRGCVSIEALHSGQAGQSAKVESHTGTQCLRLHHSELDAEGRWTKPDELLPQADEPTHDELFQREQAYFLHSIVEDLDLSELHQATCDSLRIVLAADESFRTGKTVELR